MVHFSGRHRNKKTPAAVAFPCRAERPRSPATARGGACASAETRRHGEAAMLWSRFASQSKHLTGHIEAALQLLAVASRGGIGGLLVARRQRHATSALKSGRCKRPPVVTSEYATSASWRGSTHRVSCILMGFDRGGSARTCGSSARRIERAALRSQPVPTAPT